MGRHARSMRHLKNALQLSEDAELELRGMRGTLRAHQVAATMEEEVQPPTTRVGRAQALRAKRARAQEPFSPLTLIIPTPLEVRAKL